MNNINEEDIKFIISCLKDGKPLPDSFRFIIPFETKKEYELIYDEKEREEDILTGTMIVPLQPVKTFGMTSSWTNKIIFGDNLQILKGLMDDPEIYDKETGRGKVKLIYIDPPFATKQDFKGSQDQKAYQDKIIGSKFLEFLRERLIFMREILSDNGGLFVHLDYRKKHYIKILMDEIFRENNFRNEIVVNRIKKNIRERVRVKKLNEDFDTILFYSKKELLTILPPSRKNYKPDRWHSFDASEYRKNMDYEIFGFKPKLKNHWRWEKEEALKAIKNYKKWESEFSQILSIGEYYRNTGQVLEFLRPKQKTGKPEYFIPASEDSLCNNQWNDISAYSFIFQYPTEKNEELLERIISIVCEKPNDIVLDAFAGSGTTGAVAEKLGRRWIMIDCGKLAIYTMQKRLLNLKEEIGNKGKPLKPKPFTLYNAGLYDYKMIKDLPWDKYREFVLKLFQCRDEKHTIEGIDLDGYLGQDHVMVFNYKKYEGVALDREFIDNIHKILSNKIGHRFFIIIPAASVTFFEDYIPKGQVQYFALRIPYSIIDELHRKGFTHIKQPIRESDVNNTIDAVGFDFIQIPDAECEYFIKDKENQLEIGTSNKEAVVKINKFKSNILSKKPLELENRETLSMVMLDYDYNGEIFDFDYVFYAEEIKKQDWEIHFDLDKIDKQMMIIYIDIFGNEKREVKRKEDFKCLL